MSRVKEASSGDGPITVTVGRSPAGDPASEPASEPAEIAVEFPQEVDEAFDSIPAETQVEVYRWQPDGDLGIVGRIPAQAFSTMEVARRWGAGKFKCVARVKDKKTNRVIPGGVRQKTFSVDPAAVPVKEAAVVGTIAPAGDAAGSGLAQLLALQGQVMQTITTSLSSMMTAMAQMQQRPAEKGPDAMEMLDKVGSLIKDIMPPSTPAGSIKETMETVNEILDIKERMKPEANDEDPIVSMVRDNLPRVLETLGKFAEQSRKVPAPALPRPTPTPKALEPSTTATGTSETAAATPESETPVWQVFLMRRLPQILQWAQRDKNPEVLAQAEYELMPDEVRGPLKAFLAEPDVVASIVKVAAPFAAFTNGTDGWLDVFVLELQIQFGLVEVDEEEADDETGSVGGTPGGPGVDAGTPLPTGRTGPGGQ